MLKNTIFTTILTLIVSILSFGNQIIITYFFGASIEYKNYLSVTAFPIFIAAIVSIGINYNGYPLFINIYNSSVKCLEDFTLCTIRKLIPYVVVVFLTYGLFAILNADLTEETISKRNIDYLAIVVFNIVTSFLSILIAVINVYFNAKRKFLTPLMFSTLPYLLTFVLVYFFKERGIFSISLGLLIGTSLSFLFSFYLLYLNSSFSRIAGEERILINGMIKSIPLTAVAMGCFSLHQTVDTFWSNSQGSTLVYLSLNQRIIISFGSLIIAGPFNVFIHYLASLYKSGNNKLFYEGLLSLLKGLLLVLMISASLFSVFSELMIKLFFERGEFTAQDVSNVSKLTPLYLIGMVFMLLTAINFRVLFIMDKIREAVLISVITGFLYFALCGLFRFKLGIMGFGYAYIVSWLVSLIVGFFYIFSKKVLLNIEKRHVIEILVPFLFSVFIYFLLTYLNNEIYNWVLISGYFQQLIYVILISLLVLFAYTGILMILKVPEVIYIFNKASKKFGIILINDLPSK